MNQNVKRSVGAVVIGRNEANNLQTCLETALKECEYCVYVDSGSTDASVAIAQNLGVDVVHVDPAKGFGAARARNLGFAHVMRVQPKLFVQFLDGDTELRPGWVASAHGHLTQHPDVGCVSGRRRERAPEASVYNRIVEWEHADLKESQSFAGDVMMRASAYEQVGGFDASLIAGEEAELCHRLRKAGWQIAALDQDMTWHDLNMNRFSQWWRRAYRGGFAFGQDAARDPEGGRSSARRALIWGLALPFLTSLGLLVDLAAVFAFLLYPLQWLRLAIRDGIKSKLSWERGLFLVLGKIPEALGVLRFQFTRASNTRQSLIEYK